MARSLICSRLAGGVAVRTSLTGEELRELVVAKFGRPYDTRLCQRRDRFNKLKMCAARCDRYAPCAACCHLVCCERTAAARTSVQTLSSHMLDVRARCAQVLANHVEVPGTVHATCAARRRQRADILHSHACLAMLRVRRASP